MKLSRVTKGLLKQNKARGHYLSRLTINIQSFKQCDNGSRTDPWSSGTEYRVQLETHILILTDFWHSLHC